MGAFTFHHFIQDFLYYSSCALQFHPLEKFHRIWFFRDKKYECMYVTLLPSNYRRKKVESLLIFRVDDTFAFIKIFCGRYIIQ